MKPQLDPRDIQHYQSLPDEKLRRKLRWHIRWHRAGRHFEEAVGALTSLAIGALLIGGLVTGLWVILFR